ncbi:hypothetical protein AUJ61_01840 [Candidatus Pacearchaeota archaeon CG1_02_30_18]|nr:MAG: hypothetical protein AUJ61_01840 [Candidatus Pacearchaeota archaeon CG1_02_30_18]PIZ81754.1 MAG: hypothetical protein COX98_02745 [Candidatus Pacearchaeota archaeon CG_4_10_14_0_2_um_filter_30_11]
MKLTLANKIELIGLSEKASDLLIKILEEKIPKAEIPTKNDLEFKRMVNQIYQISPILSEGYLKMYNYLQKEKITPKSKYIKQLRINGTTKKRS